MKIIEEFLMWMVSIIGLNNTRHIKDFAGMVSSFVLGEISTAFVFAYLLGKVKASNNLDAAFSLVRLKVGSAAEYKIKHGVNASFPLVLRVLVGLVITAIWPRKSVIMRNAKKALVWAWVMLFIMILLIVFGIELSTHIIELVNGEVIITR